MLLAVDIGNTQTVIGVFDTAAPIDKATRQQGDLPGLAHHWRVSTVAERTADELALLIRELLSSADLAIPMRRGRPQPADEGVSGVVVSSSVPTLTAAVREMTTSWFAVPFVVVEPGVRTGMPILYDNPKEVGADRIANAVSAFDLYGGPAIVVDFGTTTNFDVVSQAGEFLGGAIALGLEISMEALFARAAALPRVELVEPRAPIGRSTVESMQSGALYGHAGLVDGVCRRIQKELGGGTVIATGGLSGVVAAFTETVQVVEPWLTLHGLRLLFERNVVGDARQATR